MRIIDVKLFNLAEQLSKGSYNGLQWLIDLKSDAFTAQLPGWRERLTGYVVGLWAAGFISLEQLDDFEKLRVRAEAGISLDRVGEEKDLLKRFFVSLRTIGFETKAPQDKIELTLADFQDYLRHDMSKEDLAEVLQFVLKHSVTK